MLEPAAASASVPNSASASNDLVCDPTARLHILDDQALLFHERRQKLYTLDRTAAFIWCCLEEGLQAAEAAERLAAAASLTRDASLDLVAQAIKSWRDIGLVGSADAAGEGPAEPARVPVVHPLRPVPRDRIVEQRFHVAGLDVRLRTPGADVADRVLPVFAHLPPPRDSGPSMLVEVRRTTPGYMILGDEVPIAATREIAGLAPAIKAELVQAVLARTEYRLAVHAAALAKDGRVLLLPGASGRGKTTLAAMLMASGFTFLGDDTVVLERDDLRVRPIPFALAVKAGAWDLLAPYHRRLLASPVDHRPDGRVVRYLRPDPVATEAMPAAWIVFPHWQAGGDARLTPVGRVDALRRFLSLCYAHTRRLSARDVSQLVRWISRTECLELDASNLAGAVRLLADRCR